MMSRDKQIILFFWREYKVSEYLVDTICSPHTRRCILLMNLISKRTGTSSSWINRTTLRFNLQILHQPRTITPLHSGTDGCGITMPKSTHTPDLQKKFSFVIRIKTIFSHNVENLMPEENITMVTKWLRWKLFCAHIRYIITPF